MLGIERSAVVIPTRKGALFENADVGTVLEL